MRWSNQKISNGQFSTMNHEYSISFECFAVFFIIELYFPSAFLTWNPEAKQMQNSPRNSTWDDIDIFKISMLDSTHSYIFKMQISLAPYWYVMDTKGAISGILQKQFKEFKCLENVNNLHEVTTNMVMSRSFCSEKENE